MATAAPCRAVCLGSPDEHEDRPGRAPFVPGDDFAGPARSTSVVLHERGTDLGTWAGGVSAITLFVDDLVAAKQFYQKVFHLPVAFEDEESAVFAFGDTMVNLLRTTAAAELIEPATVGNQDAGSRLQLTVTVEDVDALCAQLTAHGVELLNGPMDRPWGIRTASFRDPAGHIWEIAR